MFAIMTIKEKVQFVAVRTMMVVASVLVVGIPADLMMRGANSVFGQWLINAMVG